MSARASCLFLLALAPLLVAADKPVLVPDVSARQVQIRYSFTGAQLLLFGAVVYPGGRPPDRQVDIAVVEARAFVRPAGPRRPGRYTRRPPESGRWISAPAAHDHLRARVPP